MLSSLEALETRTSHRLHPRVDPPLPAMISGGGVELRQNEAYDWDGMRRGSVPFALFQYTLRGEGRLRFDGETFAVRPGMAMLLHFPDANRYWLPENGRWHFFYLVLYGGEVYQRVRDAVQEQGPIWMLGETERFLQTSAAICQRLLQHQESLWQLSALAYHWLMALEECRRGDPGERDHKERPHAIREAVAAAHAHFSEGISAAELARYAGLSRSHFSREFHRHLGQSPVEYLTLLRLRHAVRLLKERGASIEAVALASGFRDANYFCRRFRQHFGISPHQARQSGMLG